MPEYSSTTITPSDGVQVPGMNGSTSGNLLLSALKSYILSEKGLANGLASLDGNGKLTASQLPDLADDVIVVASYASLPATGTAGKIYITADNNKMYRWDPELTTPDYVELSIDLSEYAKIVDIQDGNIQAGVAVKAFQDAMGRAIITTYETKADASDLKDAIQKNTAEIENLKQTSAQTEITVSYPDDGNYSALMPNLVPTKSAKYAEVKSIVGKSRAWNQLAKYVSGARLSQDSEGVFSFVNGTGSIWASSFSDGFVSVNGDLVNSSHSYLVVYQYVGGTIGSGKAFFGNGNNLTSLFLLDNSSHAVIITGSSWFPFIRSDSTTDYTDLKFRLIIRDLSVIFPDLPSTDLVTSNIPNLVKRCPDLLKYDAYGTGSLVTTTDSGVKSIGVNLVNGSEMELGYYNVNTGVPIDSTTRLRTVTPIRVVPNTRYYAFCSNSGQTKLSIFMYDANMNYIDWLQPNNSNFLVSANCCFIQVCTYDGYGTTFQNDIQICLNDYADKTTYHPYMTDTLSLPTSVTLRSAGSVADTDELNVEVLVDGVKVNRRRQTKRIARADLSTATWVYAATSGSVSLFVGTLPIPAENVPDTSSVINAFADSNKVIIGNQFGWTTEPYRISGYNDGSGKLLFTFNNNSVTDAVDYLTGVNLTYARLNPVVTLLEPIINNTLKVEPNGTIETVQTQSPVLDNSMTVNFDLIP